MLHKLSKQWGTCIDFQFGKKITSIFFKLFWNIQPGIESANHWYTDPNANPTTAPVRPDTVSMSDIHTCCMYYIYTRHATIYLFISIHIIDQAINQICFENKASFVKYNVLNTTAFNITACFNVTACFNTSNMLPALFQRKTFAIQVRLTSQPVNDAS